MSKITAAQEAKYYDGRISMWNSPQEIDIEKRLEQRVRKGAYSWFLNKKLYDTLRNHPSGRVLDVACGPGFLSVLLAKFGHQVVSIDISPKMIEYASELARLNGCEDKIEFRVMDASKLEFDDNSFDFITGEDALHHIIKYPGAMQHLYRVLKTKGKVYFSEPFTFNIAINILRYINVKIRRYEGEHFLGRRELKKVRATFDDVTISERAVLYPFARFFMKDTQLNTKINICIKRTDDILQKILPFFNRCYALAFMELSKK